MRVGRTPLTLPCLSDGVLELTGERFWSHVEIPLQNLHWHLSFSCKTKNGFLSTVLINVFSFWSEFGVLCFRCASSNTYSVSWGRKLEGPHSTARGDFSLIKCSFSQNLPSISSLAALSIWEPRILLSYCFAPFAWSKIPLGCFLSQAVGCHLRVSWGSHIVHFCHIPLAVSHVTICSEARKSHFFSEFLWTQLNPSLIIGRFKKKCISCMCEKAVHFLIIGYRILFVVIRSSLLIVSLTFICPTFK